MYWLDASAILTEPKNAVVKQYKQLFNIDDVELIFDDDALEAVAEDALAMKTGARGLRTIIEQSLLDVMFEFPSISDARKCILDKDSIRMLKRPLLLSDTGADLTWGELKDMTA